MPRVELRAGTIEYQDTAAAGLVVVVLLLLHGLPMDSSLWRHVVGELAHRPSLCSVDAAAGRPPAAQGMAVGRESLHENA
jgi:pimeloyl-ACP methyl ester carboxylesterase